MPLRIVQGARRNVPGNILLRSRFDSDALGRCLARAISILCFFHANRFVFLPHPLLTDSARSTKSHGETRTLSLPTIPFVLRPSDLLPLFRIWRTVRVYYRDRFPYRIYRPVSDAVTSYRPPIVPMISQHVFVLYIRRRCPFVKREIYTHTLVSKRNGQYPGEYWRTNSPAPV